VPEFLNTLRGLGTEYRNRVVVMARQATQHSGFGSLESILWLLKSLKIRALNTYLLAHAPFKFQIFS
jgi:hypothetical protein